MSIEVVVADDDIDVATDAPVADVVVATESAGLVEVVVGPGEGDAEVEVSASPEAEIEVSASATQEVEVVEHDTVPVVDHVIEIISGPRGEKGDPGYGMPPGGDPSQVLVKATSADFDFTWADPADGEVVLDHYVYNQAVPAQVWTISHPLPFRPAVSIVDSAGTAVEGDVAYLAEDLVQITFSSGFSGSAYLS